MPMPDPRDAWPTARSRRAAARIATVLIWAAMAMPATSQTALQDPKPLAMTASHSLIELAALRGIIDRCTRAPNQVDFPGLIDAVVASESAGLLDRLSGAMPRRRAELQAGVNLAYTQALPADRCGSATDLLFNAGRADALAAGLNELRARRR